MTVTLQDVAVEAGVSKQAVSQALNEKGRLRRQTRQRILATAERLGYRLNAAAKATRAGRFGAVGLLLSATSHIRSLLPGPLLAGVQEALGQHDLNLMVTSIPDERLTNEGYVPRMLRELSADGLLINYNAQIPEQMVELIETHHLLSVWLNNAREHDAVRPDDYRAAVELTERVLALGHRRVAYLDFIEGPDGHWHYSGVDRRRGYDATMKEAGLSPLPIGSALLRGGDLMVRHIADQLRDSDRPTAMICYTALETRGAIAAAYQAGLRVPEDLSVACFAESVPHDVGKKVATMLLPEEQVGVEAVQMLLKKIKSPDRPLRTRAIPFRFEPAETLGKPA